ncbi:MAG: glutamate formimidoyltransferase [Desulfobacterales bacterium CG07_land_8_20_14_0_80_52_14]|nr:MAG: glutamate formimidoyltransferase [Desulfobacterales bacterium CG23_combo_of_CG06-09_8_20_14_all_52_9]PIU50424.1 MAG: glutamate formimidoyltransferase [Desulfobacterales bacterium CG07_land_8_20_14_0_80_52_14]
MPKPLIECVPNFSEGRDAAIIEAIMAPFRKKNGCTILDYRADPDHNRLVVSLAGRPEPLQDALLEASEVAIEKIDLERHRGRHPRIGAVDVIPFTPIRNTTMEDCIKIAHHFGRRFYEATRVPVYFYEEAALRPERRRLEVIRRGEYETLKTEVSRPERHPDIGKPELHPSAGATVIGARKFLIAFNVNLGTKDLEVARRIAQTVRASSGGLCHVKGIGLALEDRGLTQVSINIVDYEKNALYRVVELIRMEARRWGVAIVETEVYGMVPAAALLDSLSYYMQMAGFQSRQVIELALLDLKEDSDRS